MPRESGLFKCQVVLLDNSTFTTSFEKRKETKGKELLRRVCIELNIPPRDQGYFGIQSTKWEDGALSWLEMEKDLRSQFLKLTGFQFAVRFYPRNIDLLSEISRELLCLQVKDSIIRGKFLKPVSIDQQAVLDSYFAQLKLGDYDSKKNSKGYLVRENSRFFVPPNGLNSDGEINESDYEEIVKKMHKKLIGESPARAGNRFLRAAESIPFYGICTHHGATDENGNSIVIGCCNRGLIFYEGKPDGEPGKLLSEFEWHEVIGARQHEQKLHILSLNNKEKVGEKLTFYFHGVFGHTSAKRVLKDLIAHQRLFDQSENLVGGYTRPRLFSIGRTIKRSLNRKRNATFDVKSNRRQSMFGRVKSSLKRRISGAELNEIDETKQSYRASVITVEECLEDNV
ncbi:predicted protein [Nematostella vectensis]|uniref:FERM domain-containing protein n=1 Tax=Nematostella vectensis TaxID=45351 RepID=A7SJC5_NEMVE|nr:band 4.1-like protein 4A [Nematostella vectensis]EDO36210.1 predicted protein [Nematostella vectensis]|eukprot:XP_001628273.1 predicted protein [Nematostella vectensis]